MVQPSSTCLKETINYTNHHLQGLKTYRHLTESQNNNKINFKIRLISTAVLMDKAIFIKTKTYQKAKVFCVPISRSE